MKVECPRCHTHVEMPADGDPVCPTCGFGSSNLKPVGAPPGAPGGPTPVAPAAPAYGVPQSGWAPPAGGEWSQGGPKPQLNQTMAITSLVLGILGCCLFGPLTGIPAAIVGGIAMKKAKDQPDVYGGNGMALAGLILGIIATVAGIIWIALVIAGFSAIPDECWVDPESPECQEATGNDTGALQYAPLAPTGTAMAATPPLVAKPWRHAG